MKKLIFSATSDHRLPPFKTATLIWQENGIKTVEKRPYNGQAIAHVNAMEASYKALQTQFTNTAFDILPYRKENNGLFFAFVQGDSLEAYLSTVLHTQGTNALIAEIKELFSKLNSLNKPKPFIKTVDFMQVFGDVSIPDHWNAYDFNNIDLNFDNLILHAKNRYTIIDYEWCFNFPIPLRYILCRALWAFQEKYQLQALNLFSALGFSEDEVHLFVEMDCNFNCYVFGSASFDMCIPGPAFLKREWPVEDSLEELKHMSVHLRNLEERYKGIRRVIRPVRRLFKP